ncbi:MAG TPA: S8 family serine peptidase [Parafilimonas sp.]
MKLKFYAVSCMLLTILLSFNQLKAQVTQQTLKQIELLQQEKNSRSPIEQKIDSRLLQAVREKAGQVMAKGVRLEPANVNADNLGNLTVDISTDVSDQLLVKMQALGAKIIFPSAEYHTIRATINLSMIRAIAAYPEVKFIQPAVQSETVGKPNFNIQTETNVSCASDIKVQEQKREASIRKQLIDYLQKTGNIQSSVNNANVPVISEGDRDHRADDARNKYGYSGEGIKIGVLSNSFNAQKGAAADVASGDLPGKGNPFGYTTPVTVVQDQTSKLLNNDDEGRAMLQIVHDLVPKAQLFFATANISEAGFATNIKKLRNTYGCDIIIDDVSYYDEPCFQDGIVAQAVNSVMASGAMYFSSAGNSGSLAKNTSGVFEGDFNDAGSLPFSGGSKSGTIHNFGTVGSPLNGDIITVQGNLYNLNWSDALGKSSNDYDLFLVSASGTVKASSTNIQNGTQNPYEQISTKALVAGDRLVVFKTTAAAKRAFHLNTNRGALSIGTNGQTAGHAMAINAFSVAATPAAGAFQPGDPVGPYPNAFSSVNKTENFSSDGPRRVFFNADTTAITPGNFLFSTNGGTVRQKPDVTAADGVSTTFASSTGLSPFYGTSAAAPHAGAIAALLKSADPTLTPAQIRSLLTSTAVDIESPGYDNVSGYGILQAYQAMQSLSPTPFANLIVDSVFATEGTTSNHNGVIDPGESVNIVVKLKNPSLVAATAVKGTLKVTTTGVTVTQPSATYGKINAGKSVANTSTPYVATISSSVACGTVIDFFLTVKFTGGKNPSRIYEFTVGIGAQPYKNIAAHLGTPTSGTGYTVSTGTQTGRLSRGSTASSCGSLLANPGILTSAGLDPRLYDAYTFTNTSSVSQCITTTMTADSGLSLYCVAYNDSGFVAADPSKHFLADPGQSAAIQTYSYDVASGKSFTVVVHEVNSGTLSGTPYNLSVSLSNCSTAPLQQTNTNIAAVTLKNGSVSISPNPASDVVNITSGKVMNQIQLISPSGQILKVVKPGNSNYNLQLGNLSGGEYFLKIFTNDGIINQKIIKQ